MSSPSTAFSSCAAASDVARRSTRSSSPSRWEPQLVSERGHRLRPPYIAVIGDGEPRGPDAHRLLEWAEEIGSLLARAGAVVVTGGLGGIME
ncbi:MAG TPA: hypothetical protein VFU44_00910, partial [Candidatus Limnocylindria bacterium]|nr:hypothetical protein [Candidatus Limnocylindria bacterium]